MTSPSDDWRPGPELLAAYFDGECEGRDDLADLKQRIEDWLSTNPDAQQELADHRHLLHVWQETAPPEPSAEQWEAMLARLEPLVSSRAEEGRPGKAVLRAPRFSRGASWSIAAAVAFATAASVAFLVVYQGWEFGNGDRKPTAIVPRTMAPLVTAQVPKEEDDEILPVADAREVAIVRVEGDDTHTLVVGELPLQGNLELVAAGDVILTQVRPDAQNKSVQPVHFIQSSSPMIWAKLESEKD